MVDMPKVDDVQDEDLLHVTGGWDWGRTGRAAGDGLASVWNAAQNVSGSPTGSTAATKTLGAVGSATVIAPVFWGIVNPGYDAVRQGLGYPEHRLDRQGLWDLGERLGGKK
jgi:hypothetical protein